jgi:hypothetical protein
VEDTAGLGLKRIVCHLLEFLVQGLQDGVANIISRCAFEFRNVFTGRGGGEVDAIDVRGFSLTTGEVDVNVQRNFDVAFCDGLEEGSMRRISRVSGVRRVGFNAILVSSIPAKWTITPSIA